MHISFRTTPVSLMFMKQIDRASVQNGMKRVIRNMVDREGRVQQGYLQRLTANWVLPEDPPVDVEYEVEETADQISVTVKINHRIFYFVDQGTSHRFATMTKDFVPRTRPGSLTSGSKKGGVAYISRIERPGIESRRFIDTLYEKRRPIFHKQTTRYISENISKYFGRLFGN